MQQVGEVFRQKRAALPGAARSDLRAPLTPPSDAASSQVLLCLPAFKGLKLGGWEQTQVPRKEGHSGGPEGHPLWPGLWKPSPVCGL